jgi:hypothetical protein
VKPAASRSESKEMYFLGRGYDESMEEAAIKIRQDRKEIDALKTPKDFEEYEKKLVIEAK